MRLTKKTDLNKKSHADTNLGESFYYLPYLGICNHKTCKFSKIVTSWTEEIQGKISGEANEEVASGPSFRDAVRAPFESFALSFCIALLKSLSIHLEPHLISFQAGHMFIKIKQKLCVNVSKVAPHFNVLTQNNLKSNGFKQFTMWNGLSRRSKFPGKMNNFTCFQRMKFLYSMCKMQSPLFSEEFA